jgi:hypothetical protein
MSKVFLVDYDGKIAEVDGVVTRCEQYGAKSRSLADDSLPFRLAIKSDNSTSYYYYPPTHTTRFNLPIWSSSFFSTRETASIYARKLILNSIGISKYKLKHLQKEIDMEKRLLDSLKIALEE